MFLVLNNFKLFQKNILLWRRSRTKLSLTIVTILMSSSSVSSWKGGSRMFYWRKWGFWVILFFLKVGNCLKRRAISILPIYLIQFYNIIAIIFDQLSWSKRRLWRWVSSFSHVDRSSSMMTWLLYQRYWRCLSKVILWQPNDFNK